ncbi:MAG: hypothetical protein Q8850_02600, partial [Candidatus Phytoplasma australasiaticum]|nr:hypothetical protein [Candidatus Phytoplasma australasiaticum]
LFLFKANSWFISYFSVPFLIPSGKTYICVFVLGLIFYIYNDSTPHTLAFKKFLVKFENAGLKLEENP